MEALGAKHTSALGPHLQGSHNSITPEFPQTLDILLCKRSNPLRLVKLEAQGSIRPPFPRPS
eukprot:3472004-Amphidinium_carterae.1